MRNGRRSRWYTLAAVAVVAPLLALALPETADQRPECAQAQAWAADHAQSLPTSLAEVAAFPPAHRRAIFELLPAAGKAALWQERLAQHAALPLSADQRALVDEARGFVSARTFETRSVPAAWEARARAAFDRATYRRLFNELADSEGELTPATAGVLLKQRWNALLQAHALPLCECSDDGDCWGGTCTYRRCSWQWGCGPFGTDICIGVCW
jgi:hypothetical protein